MSRNRNNRFNLLLTEGLLLLYNRGARMILGMPRGFYEGYARELLAAGRLSFILLVEGFTLYCFGLAVFANPVVQLFRETHFMVAHHRLSQFVQFLIAKTL